jgi:hypothetical protein
MRRAVAKGLRRWQAALSASPRDSRDGNPVAEEVRGKSSNGRRRSGTVGSLSRRQQIEVAADREFAPPPMRQVEVFHASVARSLGRLVVWVAAFVRFWAVTTWDRVRGRDSVERRAVRLRETLQGIGGTFIKFGQQLSVRVDVLPYAYCRELMKMLDRVPEFPVEQAIAVIERATGRPLAETFAVFDPEPIGSASLACVYQADRARQLAVRHTGGAALRRH